MVLSDLFYNVQTISLESGRHNGSKLCVFADMKIYINDTCGLHVAC